MCRIMPLMAADCSQPMLSVVVPAYNEQDNIEPLLAQLVPVLESLTPSFEITFVDDGSRDNTAARVSDAGRRDPRVRLLRFSRNFGHQAALFAGIEHAAGQAVVMMDGDLQHPPEIVRRLFDEWRGGGEVVQAVRRAPADDSLIKRTTSGAFYHVLSRLSRTKVTPGASDFRLMNRDAVCAFLQCRERCRFNRGLVQWIGFDYREVVYDAAPRHAGRSKYSLRSMLRLAGDAIFSFSAWPLRLAGLAGVVVSLAAAVYLIYVIIVAAFTKFAVPGWSSILATLLIIGGLQLIVLWILGEYVGRLYEEAKQRPIYILRGRKTADAAPCNDRRESATV
ncbi:MAG: glycosyltransferase family 2 protein [Phycisphaerales bacterium]|nr:glycosyltransferase family 2 protein [Phycisphaerales bacterium]